MNRDFTQLKPWVHKDDAAKIRELVKDGEFVSVSEFCRKAVRQLLKEYFSKTEPIEFKVKKDA